MKDSMEYGWIREGYTPQPHTWHAITDCLPKMGSNDRTFADASLPVLLCLGTYQRVGYVQQWEDDTQPQWILAGRDMYHAENVTHWRWLPSPPSEE